MTEWHPLIDHCLDVAICTYYLLEHSVIGTRINALCDLSGSRERFERLAFLAGLHDCGKFNSGFQKRCLNPYSPGTGHVGEMMSLFVSASSETASFAEALDFHALLAWCESEESLCELLASVICHHGRPVCSTARVNPQIWRPWKSLDPFTGVADLVATLRKVFPLAFEPGRPFPSSVCLQHALCGVVTLADWIASDTRFFPYAVDAAQNGRVAFAREQCEQATCAIGLNSESARRTVASRGNLFFGDIWKGKAPRPVQRSIDSLKLPSEPAITIMESGTGSGKTEAALLYFFKLFQSGAVDGLYFALPTRTSAIQIFRRVRDAVQATLGENAPPVVLAVPGYLQFDGEIGQRLAPFECLWGDGRERSRHRGWAAEHPKRYLAAAIAVGTIDQVLFSTLAVRHSHMRAVSLLRHLIVVDEVHASDAYMAELLKSVLQRHCSAGGHALLMSATLGSIAASTLNFPTRRSAPPSLQEATTLSYPLVRQCLQDSDTVMAIPAVSQQVQKEISIEIHPWADDVQAIATCAIEVASAGAKVLILRNTVNDAVAVQTAIEQQAESSEILFRCAGIPAPHHARYSREDRELLDETIETIFGKSRTRGGCVAVATQTVQQSLDLDADFMLTDLCPMDVLLQRAGRLHRHTRTESERAAAFRNPRLAVLVPEQRDMGGWINREGAARGPHGYGSVYDDLCILEATWRLLETHETLYIPRMNRSLVELSTHPEALESMLQELGSAWRRHADATFAARIAETQAASLNMADWSGEFGSYCFPEDRQNKIATRLGASDFLVHFDSPVTSPFGQQMETLTIPFFQGPDDPPDDGRASDVCSGTESIFFKYGNRAYVYDRHGLHCGDRTSNTLQERRYT